MNLREMFTNLREVFVNLHKQFAKLRKVFANYCTGYQQPKANKRWFNLEVLLEDLKLRMPDDVPEHPT